MNLLKSTAMALTSLAAIGLYSAPAMSAMVDATGASFLYGLNQDGITYASSGGITTANGRHLNTNATDASTTTFRSLGLNGMGVFEFGTAFTGTVTIWETTFNGCADSGGDGACDHWPEKVSVYAGNTWSNNFSNLVGGNFGGWTKLGELGNFDAQGGGSLTANDTFTYLLLVDHGLQTSNPRDGFDVAKVSVSAVPIPAAGWLFGSALLGIAGIARNRRKTAS